MSFVSMAHRFCLRWDIRKGEKPGYHWDLLEREHSQWLRVTERNFNYYLKELGDPETAEAVLDYDIEERLFPWEI